MNILDAMDDPRLFGRLFDDPSWAAWKAFLAALFALPMDDEAFALYMRHTGRTTPPAAPFREGALIIGRRGGKSRVLAAIAVYAAAFRDYREFVVPGEVPTVGIVAADRRQARVLLRYVVGTLKAVAMLEGLVDEEMAESVTLTNGVTVEIHTGSIGSPRGRTFVAVLCDEIAFWRSEDSANPDAEVINAVRPGLASIPGSILLMASSPYARRGVLWNAFKKHYGRDDARTLVWRGTTAEMNPQIPPELIAEAYEEDPAAAGAEYGAEFRSDAGAFLPREVVEAAVTRDVFELAPAKSRRYRAWCDPSGGSSDSMTLGIAHKEGAAVVLDLVREVRPPFSPDAVVVDFVNTLRRYGIQSVRGDHYAGLWPRERFWRYGVNYETSELPASGIYLESLPLLMAGNARLLDNPRLISQLCNLERRTSRGGKDQISHPSGGHDDVANSACGALVEANKSAGVRVQRLGY